MRHDFERTELDRWLHGGCAWCHRPGSRPASGEQSAPGSRRLPSVDTAAVHAGGLSSAQPGREQEPHSERRRTLPIVPPHRFAMPRCAQASPALGGEQIDRHAIALSSRDTPSRRFGLQRCAATPAKSLKLFVRAGAQPPAWSSPALEEVRSPPAPQMRDTGRTAASLMDETSLVACRLPFGTISFLQPATYQLGPQHPHLPYLPQSQPRTAAADPVLPRPGDLVRTMAPDQTDPNAAFAPSSQLLLSKCCDDHLSPGNTPAPTTPPNSRRIASSRA